MKKLIAILLVLFSINAFSESGDKGNVAGPLLNLNTSSLEMLFNLTVEVEENLYEPLSTKHAEIKNGKVEIVGIDNLENEKLITKYVSLINELMIRQDEEMLASLTYENDLFYRAFSTTEFKSQLALKQSLDARFIKFFSEVATALKSKRGIETVNKLIKKIDTSKLGYRLSNF